MLKTNSKIVRERVRAYINETVNFDDYTDIATPETFAGVCREIYKCFFDQAIKHDSRYRKFGFVNEREYFAEWLRGLPGVLDCAFLYKCSAVEMLGNILEETAKERGKYDEMAAEDLFMYLIWREIEQNRRLKK